MARLLEQARARRALDAVQALHADAGGKAEEITQELKGLPARIQSCGLGQTLAFYASKGGHHAKIGAQLALGVSPTAKDTLTFLNEIMQGDAASYRRATREALALAEWMKRYGAARQRARD